MATQKVIDLYARYRKEKKDASADILLGRFPELGKAQDQTTLEELPAIEKEVDPDAEVLEG